MPSPSAFAIASRVLIAAVALGSVAHADVWTWKDATGVTHYSDQPIEGAVRVKTTVPHGATGGSSSPASTSAPASGARTDSKARLAAMNEAAEATRNRSNAEIAVQQDLARKQEEQCKLAKASYENSINSRRIIKQGADGAQQYMSDPEADEYRVKARSDMESLCGKPPP